MVKLWFVEEQLLLNFSIRDELDRFIRSPKYKIKIKRYVDKIDDKNVYLKKSMTIHDIKKIINLLNNQLRNFHLDPEVEGYISKREFYIENRYRVGNDIKKRDNSILENFYFFKSKVDRIFVRPLTDEQMWNAYYMSVMKNCSNFSVPGSGKTATVLGTYAFLKEKKETKRIVMIGPKNAFGSWIDEFRTCFRVDSKTDDFYLNIHSKELKSAKDRKYHLTFESGNKELILINYESLGSLEEVLKVIIDKNTLLVFDEVHKIKNPSGQRAKTAIEVSTNAGRILTLTGTPIPNSYQDLFNTLNVLYPEDYNDFFGYSVRELKNAGENEMVEINRKLKPFFCRVTKEQQQVPPPNTDIIEQVDASEIENRLFKIIYQTYKSNLFALMARLMQLGSNPKLLLQNIDESVFGSIIDDESDFSIDIDVKDYTEEIVQLVNQVEQTSKTKQVLELIDKLVAEDKKVIVWCIFVSSIHLLEKKCLEKGFNVKTIYGETPLEERLELIRDYQNGKFDVLITNPHTLAESVSLHQVCHDAIYYEYSFNLVHLLQSKDRIHRLGLASEQYTQYYFMEVNYIYNDKNYSLDNRIYCRLKDKERVMLKAISNDTLEHVTSFEKDLEIVFRGFLD
ncbi:DEAD/DEAH box helicase [Brochothrix thermosphacta]|uniref:DEAD/DEAH box helicase n=1 Tax=Brochothrix thermosphacta TaxID=2756 RepID=UPI0039AF8D5F